MHGERPAARLNLDHTVVTLLEAANGHEGDVGSDHGVDEFHYHFEEPTQIRLSLDRFDEAPELIALDDSGNEIAHVTAESGDAMITMSGHHTLRLVHPHAGDATADADPALPPARFLPRSTPSRRSRPSPSGGRPRRRRRQARAGQPDRRRNPAGLQELCGLQLQRAQFGMRATTQGAAPLAPAWRASTSATPTSPARNLSIWPSFPTATTWPC